MHVDPRARAQKFGLFFNASQARQLNFNIRLAVLRHFSTISCSSLGATGVTAVDDRLLSRDFSPEVGPCIIKEEELTDVFCVHFPPTSPQHSDGPR